LRFSSGHWRRDGRDRLVEVEDDGPGIAHTENLFVPFFTTKAGGSGIGLVLARQVLEAQDRQLPVISLEDLIANKSATGRTQDLADVERLQALLQPKSQG